MDLPLMGKKPKHKSRN